MAALAAANPKAQAPPTIRLGVGRMKILPCPADVRRPDRDHLQLRTFRPGVHDLNPR
jgi:hypothetical protein